MKLKGLLKSIFKFLRLNVGDFILGIGLLMLFIGLWGLSDNIYIALAIIGTELLILGAIADKKD